MPSIYLCDDEPIWLERLNKAVTEYQIKNDWDFTIEYESNSPEQLLSYLSKHTPKSGIYFLDIDFKSSLNGMELAREIRRVDPQASLIFITTHDEMVMETFRLKLEALDYIVKDTSPLTEKMHQCLAHLESKYNAATSSAHSISIRAEGSYRTIPVQDIYYIETIKNSHKVRICLQNAMYHINDSIKSLQPRLGSDFYQCHRTCLVNINHIAELDIENHRVFLDNRSICPCSTREWRTLLKIYHTLHL
uniref:LytR/AlgR family response regulator transcription factor n=1 Tax=Acetatifactor sp. TaxID=1872090 RepID=UPI004057962D